jgi:hypothetical protein
MDFAIVRLVLICLSLCIRSHSQFTGYYEICRPRICPPQRRPLKLVHISNGLHMVEGVGPLQVGDVFRSEAFVTSTDATLLGSRITYIMTSPSSKSFRLHLPQPTTRRHSGPPRSLTFLSNFQTMLLWVYYNRKRGLNGTTGQRHFKLARHLLSGSYNHQRSCAMAYSRRSRRRICVLYEEVIDVFLFYVYTQWKFCAVRRSSRGIVVSNFEDCSPNTLTRIVSHYIYRWMPSQAESLCTRVIPSHAGSFKTTVSVGGSSIRTSTSSFHCGVIGPMPTTMSDSGDNPPPEGAERPKALMLGPRRKPYAVSSFIPFTSMKISLSY